MRRFGLIGKTLKHSFSKNYFERKFADEGITNCRYDNFELNSINDLPRLLLSNPDIEGLNVTIPYKEECLPFLNYRDEMVKAIGASNCIKIKGGKLFGYNTDAIAFRLSLEPFLKAKKVSALVLGSGGASKAICYALKELGIQFSVVSRQKKTGQLDYKDLDFRMIQEHRLIINTTPLGMFPDIDSAPDIAYEAISNGHILYDLTYNPEKTRFLLQGQERGASIINGYSMLVLQAEESWRIWMKEN